MPRCPITKETCDESGCAWWRADDDLCAFGHGIMVIASAISGMAGDRIVLADKALAFAKEELAKLPTGRSTYGDPVLLTKPARAPRKRVPTE